MDEIDVEQFKLKLKETSKDLIHIASRVKKKSNLYLAQLTDNDNIQDIEGVGIHIVNLLETLTEDAASIIKDLKNNISGINEHQTEKLFEQLYLKLVKYQINASLDTIRDIQKCEKSTNTEDSATNLVGETNGTSRVETEITEPIPAPLSAPVPSLSLALKRDRRSETPDTDDAWNDTLNRPNPNDVIVNCQKKEEPLADSSDDSDDFDKDTVDLNSPPDPDAIDFSGDYSNSTEHSSSDKDEKRDENIQSDSGTTLKQSSLEIKDEVMSQTTEASQHEMNTSDGPSTQDIEAILAEESKSPEPEDALTSKKGKKAAEDSEPKMFSTPELTNILDGDTNNTENGNGPSTNEIERILAEDNEHCSETIVPFKPDENSENQCSDINKDTMSPTNSKNTPESVEGQLNDSFDDLGSVSSERNQEHGFSEECDSDHTYCKPTQRTSPIVNEKDTDPGNKSSCSSYSASTYDADEDKQNSDHADEDQKNYAKTENASTHSHEINSDYDSDATDIENALNEQRVLCDEEDCNASCKGLESNIENKSADDHESLPSTPNILEKDLYLTPSYTSGLGASQSSSISSSDNAGILEKDLYLSQSQSITNEDPNTKHLETNSDSIATNSWCHQRPLSQCSTDSYVFHLDETVWNIGLNDKETPKNDIENMKTLKDADGDSNHTVDDEDTLTESLNSNSGNGEINDVSDANTVHSEDLGKEDTPGDPSMTHDESLGENSVISENGKLPVESPKDILNVTEASIVSNSKSSETKDLEEKTAISENDSGSVEEGTPKVADESLVGGSTNCDIDNQTSDANAKEITSEIENLDEKSTISETDCESANEGTPKVADESLVGGSTNCDIDNQTSDANAKEITSEIENLDEKSTISETDCESANEDTPKLAEENLVTDSAICDVENKMSDANAKEITSEIENLDEKLTISETESESAKDTPKLAEENLIEGSAICDVDNKMSANAKEITSEIESLDEKSIISETESESAKESDDLFGKSADKNSAEQDVKKSNANEGLSELVRDSVPLALSDKGAISESDNKDNGDSGSDSQKTELLYSDDYYDKEENGDDIADELLALLKEEDISDKDWKKDENTQEKEKTPDNNVSLSDEEKAAKICKLWNNLDTFSDSDSESDSNSDINVLDDSNSDLDGVGESTKHNDEHDHKYYQELIKKHNFDQCFVRLEQMDFNKVDFCQNKYTYDSDDRLCDLSTLDVKRKHDTDSSLNNSTKTKHKRKVQKTKSKHSSSSDSSNSYDSDMELMGYSSSNPKHYSDLEQELDETLARSFCKQLENSGREDNHNSPDELEELEKEKNNTSKLNHANEDKEGITNEPNSTSNKEELSGEENIEKKKLTKEELQKKAWRRDPLLRGSLISDSDSCQVITYKSSPKKRRKRRISSDQEIVLITEISDSDSDSDNKVAENKAKLEDTAISPIKRNIPISDSSDSDSDIEFIAQKDKTPKDKEAGPSPSQKAGRRNIRALVSDECLAEATQKAMREEQERIERLEEQQQRLDIMSQSQSLTLSQTQDEDDVEPLILDVDDLGEPLITVHPKLVKRLKPHQRDGVKFLWNSCYESVERLKTDDGTGCILAHCMGLGKTFQVIALIQALFNCKLTKTKRVLVVCPLSTVSNWTKEVKLVFKDIPKEEFEVLTISSKRHNKYDIVTKWHIKKKVVLIIGYECFERLTNEDRLQTISPNSKAIALEALIDPGPDLIVCDEGHLLKNRKALKTQALNRVKTKRRIVLTGTPLQNNLTEYYHMVNFVKPNLLGTYREYKTNFENPINNGQYEDSTKEDIRLMKARIHVLHKILGKTIHRIEDTELLNYLPKMIEFTLFIQLHQTQVELYNHFCKLIEQNVKQLPKTVKFPHQGNFFSDVEVFRLICTHPQLLALNEKTTKRREQDLIVDEADINPANTRAPTYLGDGWWKTIMPEDVAEKVEYGTKLRVLKGIIEECEAINDKLLVFSQSLNELDLIEHFLKTVGTTGCPSWKKQKDYYRMDGTVPPEIRPDICDKFNNPTNTKARLLLMSVRVGGLGLNLTAANRVVIMTVNWNPSYDIQSIFRVYRFGQQKEVCVYRLVSLGSMEEKIYQRQVTKLAVAHRVVDKHQISRHYKSMDLLELYACRPNADEERPTPNVPEDQMLANLILKLPCIFRYHEHRALLANRPEDNLNETELAAAWDEFKTQQEQQRQQQQQQQQLILQQQQQLQQQQRNGPVTTPLFPQSNIVPTTSAGTTLNGPNLSDAFQLGRLNLNQIITSLQNSNNINNNNNVDLKQYFNPKTNPGNNSAPVELQLAKSAIIPSAQNVRSQSPQILQNQISTAKNSQVLLPSQNLPKQMYSVKKSQNQGAVVPQNLPNVISAVKKSGGTIPPQKCSNKIATVKKSHEILLPQNIPNHIATTKKSPEILPLQNLPNQISAVKNNQGIIPSQNVSNQVHTINKSRGTLPTQNLPSQISTIKNSQGIVPPRNVPNQLPTVNKSRGTLQTQNLPNQISTVKNSPEIVPPQNVPNQVPIINKSRGTLPPQNLPNQKPTVKKSQGTSTALEMSDQSVVNKPGQTNQFSAAQLQKFLPHGTVIMVEDNESESNKRINPLYASSKEKITTSKLSVPPNKHKTGQKENVKIKNKNVSNAAPNTSSVVRRQFDNSINSPSLVNASKNYTTSSKLVGPVSFSTTANFTVRQVPNKRKSVNPSNQVSKKKKNEALTKPNNIRSDRRPSINHVGNNEIALNPSTSNSNSLSNELIKHLGKGGVSVERIMKENNTVKKPVILAPQKKPSPRRNSSIVWDHSYSRRKFYRDYY